MRLDKDVRPSPMAVFAVPISINTSYGTAEQAACLDSFLKRAAPMISMTCPVKDLWTIIMPQVSWQSTPVKYMICALALMDLNHDEGDAPQHQVKHAQFAKILKLYDQAISAGSVSESLDQSSAVLFSLMAWNFENIINNYPAARVHENATRSMLADSRKSGKWNSVQARLIMERVERVIDQGSQNDIVCDWPSQTHPWLDRSFTTLDEAWRGLHYVVDMAAGSIDMLVAHGWGPVGRSLDGWRAAFEHYRYLGSASLQQKRSIILAENMVATYLASMDPQSTQLWWQRERDCTLTLGDLESFVSTFDSYDDIRWIAKAILLSITDVVGGSDMIMMRVRRLIRLFDNSASKSREINDELKFIVNVESTMPAIHASLKQARDLWIERNGATRGQVSQHTAVAWYQTETKYAGKTD